VSIACTSLTGRLIIGDDQPRGTIRKVLRGQLQVATKEQPGLQIPQGQGISSTSVPLMRRRRQLELILSITPTRMPAIGVVYTVDTRKYFYSFRV
jgi:hypothetical protein